MVDFELEMAKDSFGDEYRHKVENVDIMTHSFFQTVSNENKPPFSQLSDIFNFKFTLIYVSVME